MGHDMNFDTKIETLQGMLHLFSRADEKCNYFKSLSEWVYDKVILTNGGKYCLVDLHHRLQTDWKDGVDELKEVMERCDLSKHAFKIKKMGVFDETDVAVLMLFGTKTSNPAIVSTKDYNSFTHIREHRLKSYIEECGMDVSITEAKWLNINGKFLFPEEFHSL